MPRVLGDRVQVQQVLLNLILNAVEAMASVDDRPRELTIITQVTQDNYVQIAINHLTRTKNLDAHSNGEAIRSRRAMKR